MAERIARTSKKKEPGMLYYVKADEEGYLCIFKAPLMRNGKHKIDRKKLGRKPIPEKNMMI